MFSPLLLLLTVGLVTGHGYLKDPPARNCMWRFGYSNPTNYNDNQQFCGGSDVQNRQNGGKCGVCGDPYHWSQQPHMDGGKYSNNIIGKTYKRGQTIEVEVLLTASHKGYFEFRVGDFSNRKTSGDSMGKLSGHLMTLASGGTRYMVQGSGNSVHMVRLGLPGHLTCKRCVVQWWYKTGNSWGCDAGGSCGLGKGEQEHFVNCADVKIE